MIRSIVLGGEGKKKGKLLCFNFSSRVSLEEQAAKQCYTLGADSSRLEKERRAILYKKEKAIHEAEKEFNHSLSITIDGMKASLTPTDQ